MSNKSGFLKFRYELDDALTYGTKKQAMQIARKGLEQAQQQDLPGEIEYFRAQKLIIQNKFAGAIDHLDAAIKYNPYDGAAYNDRALCMVELGILDASLAYFDKGIEVEPDFATIHHNKGWFLNNIGEYTKALQCLYKALELQPDRAVTYDNIADALYNLGDYKGACQAYRKVLSLLKPRSCSQVRKQINLRLKELESRICT